MALTPEGTPYVEASDLVAAYPAASLSLANRVDLVGVLPFADSAARATAIPSPTDGQYSYLQDTDSTQFWNGSAWIAAGGKVLQVVQASSSTSTTIASTSYTDTTLSGTITPSLATSKILVLVSQISSSSRSAANIFTSVQLLRGATVLSALGDSLGMQPSGATSVQISLINPMLYLDSPNTTSATTYKTQGKVNTTANSGAVVFQHGNQPSYIVLIEVAA